MTDFNFTIKNGGGTYNLLDIAYNKLIKTTLINNDESETERWETYEVIISELVNCGKTNYFEEIKYRLTDDENPNEVILEIINRDEDLSGLIHLLKKRIENYLEEDSYRRFYE